MKKGLLIALCSLVLFACNCKKGYDCPELPTIVDTVYVADTVYMDRVEVIETIPQEYLEYKLIVLNVKHYVDITEARPANKTYFYGWIRRSVDGVPELIERDKQKYGEQ